MLRSVQEAAEKLRSQSDRELQATTHKLRERIFLGTSPVDESIVVPGFALMNEAIRRTLGYNYYEVQLLAGWVLAQGQIAEMQTGEGKTLVAGLPAFVHALTGQGVHVITANSYLAARDCAELSPAFELLGVTAKLLPERAETSQKQPAYQADITYGTGYEFGFDYLRDQVTLRQREQAPLGQTVLDQLAGLDDNAKFIQRQLKFAIIDEIDSVLIDDANSPLVLSESTPRPAEDTAVHLLARNTIRELQPEFHYVLNSVTGHVQLTSAGLKQIHAYFEQVPLASLKRPWAEYIKQALRAECFYRRNVHYIVNDQKVQLVDESTGRVFADRHWRDGLHQAIEAKEGLPITAENQPLALVTRQRFYRLYEGLCGMTGTATGSEHEFWKFYNLRVTPIPLRNPCQRVLLPPRYFADKANKWRAVAESIRERQHRGQPVLVGTRTISESENLGEHLAAEGIVHQLLNGRQDQDEAKIIAQAGEPGTVTIATNMAGRGTDIKLPVASISAGGLHVIGTERHDASRVDRQLLGRTARQGDPGSAQFFLSAEDSLIAQHHPRLARLMHNAVDALGEVKLPVTSMIDRIQRQVERDNFRLRSDLFRYDQYREDVLSRLHGSR